MDWNEIWKFLKENVAYSPFAVIIIAFLGLIVSRKSLIFNRENIKMAREKRREEKEKEMKAEFLITVKGRVITIKNSGADTEIIKLHINGIDAFNSEELSGAEDELKYDSQMIIHINKATNILQPGYKVEITYVDKYVLKMRKKKKNKTFTENFSTTVQ
ncbi:hypothetical protein FA002_00355 [Priestia megaterium]|uniref:hypothetical protein n=1 Tax=Priestia megaterium TaxID=1404 RepID=UPI0010AD9C51|nr:hypothetical protein [Priestia megaterium]TJZ40056.1 hypothetical protein FA002_00355 [Priestia megaterium]